MQTKQLIQDTEMKMKKSIDSAKREFGEVRTGRAHPGLIEGMHIDYYGTPTMLKDIASINIPDPRSILIQPWDQTAVPEIEKTINNSKLGITPSVDGKVIRLSIPPLSQERREELQKVVKEMAEKMRISLRTIRRDANDKLKKMESDKVIPEDQGFNAHDEIQKLTDRYIKLIDDILEEKSKSLMS